ncbi:MAG: zinc ribbon domain-containing protein [Desulfobacterales bacterium]|nr:MAG: zinc ribbon domain-containing protein [Desulfobacterales bacterium]
MPIYEFRCLSCDECFEILVMHQDHQMELRCPRCKSEEFERILSASSYSLGSRSTQNTAPRVQTRNCPGGSCTTYDVPGPAR